MSHSFRILNGAKKTFTQFRILWHAPWASIRPRGVVLLYHKIRRVSQDTQLLSVDPARFEEQLEILHKRYRVVSLRKLLTEVQAGRGGRTMVAVTFDDGYLDNLKIALPILERTRTPATIFVSTGYVGTDRPFYWDYLETVFIANRERLPDSRLDLEFPTGLWSWNDDINPLVQLQRLQVFFRVIPEDGREKTLSEIEEWSGIPRVCAESDRSMNIGELKAIAQSPWVELGAHTVTHCRLSSETLEEQERQIRESRERLSSWIGKPVDLFSYPYGNPDDYTRRTRQILERLGFAWGIANTQGSVSPEIDRFEVPRRLVRNWDRNVFEANLHTFFGTSFGKWARFYDRFGALLFRPEFRLRMIFWRPEKYSIPSPSPVIGRPPRVVQINTVDGRGGAAGIARALRDGLSERGWDSRLLVGASPITTFDPRTEVLNRHDRLSRQAKIRAEAAHAAGALDVFDTSLTSVFNRRLWEKADLIHLHNLHGDYLSDDFLTSVSLTRPVVWTLHDMQALTGHCAHSFECEKWITGCGACPHLSTYPALHKDTTAWHWRRKQLLSAQSRIQFVVPSRWLLEKFKKSLWAKHPVTLVYNGVDTRIFTPPRDKALLRKQLGLPYDSRILMFVADGGLGNYWKGGVYLVHALETLRREFPEIVFLALGADKHWFEKERRTYHIPYVWDHGLLAQYYQAADLLAYPSLADNCPLAVLEALACGTPVVAFSTGGIPELIEHKIDGYLAAYRDQEDFENGLRQILSVDFDHTAAQGHAVEKIRTKFSLEGMIEGYLKLYTSLLF